MSYRSIKRVLGETHLERKCRLLFGGCLALLIGVAFWWVDAIAERLVLQTTRRNCRDVVDMIMIKAHARTWETIGEARKLLDEVFEELEKRQTYDYRIVTLSDEYKLTSLPEVYPPESTAEREILERLAQLLREKENRERDAPAPADPLRPRTKEDVVESLAGPRGLGGSADVPFLDRTVFRPLPDEDAYYYYEPIVWKPVCTSCHSNFQEAGVDSAFALNPVYDASPPLYAVKVMMKYKVTQDAINQARAILIAVAIITVFLAMVALYLIVRYVVVRPLKHLRDVSEEVSRGKTEVRANIETNDEFQDLAESFNRMLRHLTDAQAELRRVNQDLDAKVDQLAQLNMQLYEMNRLKGDFLANMSHELRTPLNSIIGFSEILQSIDALNEKQKRYAQNIQKSGRVLLEMINDILDLAKLEAGKMELRPTEFHIEAVVQAQGDLVRQLAENKNIDLSVHVPHGLPPMFQDQAKIQQVLTNLLSNAIKFTPEGGRITVAARRDDDGYLEMTVADTGVGIADEDREIIFEKFRQAATVQGKDGLTREYSGTGLGLSIIKELCKLLGGEISFESELGKGSTFRVVLPWTCPLPNERRQELAERLEPLTLRQQLEALSGGPAPAPVPAR